MREYTFRITNQRPWDTAVESVMFDADSGFLSEMLEAVAEVVADDLGLANIAVVDDNGEVIKVLYFEEWKEDIC